MKIQKWCDEALYAIWALSVLGLVILFLGAPGCCSHSSAVRQAGRTAAADWGTWRDTQAEGRRVAWVNAIAWEAQHYVLSGEWRDEAKRTEVLRALGVTNEDELLAAWGEVDPAALAEAAAKLAAESGQ